MASLPIPTAAYSEAASSDHAQCGPMVGTNCTSNAEPTSTVTGIRHWVAVYDTSGGILNVWKPSVEHIQLDADHSNLMNTVVVWRDGWPAPAPPSPPTPTPKPTPIPEGDEPVLVYLPVHKQLRSFAVVGGQVHQNWPDATGGLVGHEAVPGAAIAGLPAQAPSVVEEPNGTISIEVHDAAGNRFHVYQLLGNSTWSVSQLG